MNPGGIFSQQTPTRLAFILFYLAYFGKNGVYDRVKNIPLLESILDAYCNMAFVFYFPTVSNGIVQKM